MSLIGRPTSLSLFDAPPPPKKPEGGFRAFMAAAPVTHRFERMPGTTGCFRCGLARDQHPRAPRKPKPPPTQNVAGSPLHLAKYSTTNLTDGNFLELQPSRGGWIVSLRGEFMGSVKRGKSPSHREVAHGAWLLYPMSTSPGSRSLEACRRAAELLDAHQKAAGR